MSSGKIPVVILGQTAALSSPSPLLCYGEAGDTAAHTARCPSPPSSIKPRQQVIRPGAPNDESHESVTIQTVALSPLKFMLL